MPIPKGPRRGGDVHCFEGVSEFRNENDAQALHEAIQDAAKAAATTLNLGPEDTRDFEVTQIQIIVGNPNVKVYRVVITPTP